MRQHRVNRQRPAPIPQVRGRHAGEQRFFLMAIAMAFEPTAEFGVEWFHLRISVIVDARFSLIVDGETASSRVRRGGAQARGLNVP